MDFDSLPEDPSTAPVGGQAPVAQPSAEAPASFDAMQDDGDKYGTGEQMAKTGAEGLAEGILGPIATGVERELMNVPRADILGRQKANPITHGIAQAAGLVGSAVTGVGEGAVMGAAGEAAASAVGLGDVGKGARLSYKIGSEAVKQAAEMAVLQGGDEASKMILKDPESSTESAIANVGLSAALGGAGGAAFGAISPLWSATGGKAVDAIFGAFNGKLSGGQLELPAALGNAFKDIGVEPSPLMRSALSGDPAATKAFQDFIRSEHPEVLSELKSLPEQLQKSVTDHMGLDLNDTLHFSNADNGKVIDEAFKTQISKDADPILARYAAQDAEDAKIKIPDETLLDIGDQIKEAGLGENVGVNSPSYKEYTQVANQVLDKESVGGMTKLSQDLGKTAYHNSTDPVRKDALLEIKKIIDDGIQKHIEGSAVESLGADGAKMGAEKIAEMQANKADYRQLADKYNGILDYLGMKKFTGTGNMRARLADLTPETLLKKFLTKGDVQGQKLLTEQFPEIASMVKQHETKAFLAQSIDTVEGQKSLDLNHLSNRLDALKSSGNPEYANWVVSPDAQAKLASAQMISDSLGKLKGVKNSGTPAGMAAMLRQLGSSALAGVGTVFGHNPISTYLMAEVGQHLGKTVPEAIRLGMLKQMGSKEPFKAEGFKAMTDLMHNSIKGETMLSKGAAAVFKSGAQVIGTVPSQMDRDKVDKQVTKLQEAPGKVAGLSDGSHLGHYMPDHQTALTQAQVRATQYLQQIKPQSYRPSPLDKEIEPSSAKMARYNRALDIAAQPAVIMQHIQDGTLQSSDIQDLHAMFPALAKNMAQKLSTEMTNSQESGDIVPYRTKIALAMFLGTPVDSTMSAASIMAAQPQPAQPQGQQGQAGKMKGGAKTASSMNKNADSYRTGSQAREAKQTSRD